MMVIFGLVIEVVVIFGTTAVDDVATAFTTGVVHTSALDDMIDDIIQTILLLRISPVVIGTY